MFLRHIELHVSDPVKSQEFYEKVLGFKTEDVQRGGQLIWMQLGESSILLRPGTGRTNERPFMDSPGNFVLCSDDPVAELMRMKARGLVVRGDDAGCPTFTDPDGNWFQLIGTNGTFPAP